MKKEDFIKNLETASTEIDERHHLEVLQRSIDAQVAANPQNPVGHMNLIIVMEELSELQKEISKGLRGKEDIDAILEEVADVSIGLDYIKMIYGIDDEMIRKAINVKMDRMEGILDRDGIMK